MIQWNRYIHPFPYMWLKIRSNLGKVEMDNWELHRKSERIWNKLFRKVCRYTEHPYVPCTWKENYREWQSEMSLWLGFQLKAGALSCFPFPPLLKVPDSHDHSFQLCVVSVLQLITEWGQTVCIYGLCFCVCKTVFKYIGEHQNSSCCVLGITYSFCLGFAVFQSPATRGEGSAVLP